MKNIIIIIIIFEDTVNDKNNVNNIDGLIDGIVF